MPERTVLEEAAKRVLGYDESELCKTTSSQLHRLLFDHGWKASDGSDGATPAVQSPKEQGGASNASAAFERAVSKPTAYAHRVARSATKTEHPQQARGSVISSAGGVGVGVLGGAMRAAAHKGDLISSKARRYMSLVEELYGRHEALSRLDVFGARLEGDTDFEACEIQELLANVYAEREELCARVRQHRHELMDWFHRRQETLEMFDNEGLIGDDLGRMLQESKRIAESIERLRLINAD